MGFDSKTFEEQMCDNISHYFDACLFVDSGGGFQRIELGMKNEF